MSLFWFFRKNQAVLALESLEVLRKKWINPDEFLWAIQKYSLSNMYDFLNARIKILEIWELDINYFIERFDIIQEFEPTLFRQRYETYDYVFNPTLAKPEKLKDICIFLQSEWITQPISFLKDYQYKFCDTVKAHERVKEKNKYLKNHPYLIWKRENTLDFRIQSSWLNSIKTMENELKIYKECDMIDDLLTTIKGFGYISEWKEKLNLFEKYKIPNTNRNIFLKKYFNQTLTRNCSISQLEEALSHWYD